MPNFNFTILKYTYKLKISNIKVINMNNRVISNNNRIIGGTVFLSSSLSIMFFGTDYFALESLKMLFEQNRKFAFKKFQVVTVPQKGIILPVAKFCKENKIPYKTWPITNIANEFDIGIVVSFGHLIPQSLIESFRLGMLNVHGSLLPRWRGAAPVIHTILNNDNITGVTVMRIHPHRFDVGEIIYKNSLNIPPNIKSGELTKRLASLGASCLSYCLQDLNNLLKTAQAQATFGITKAPKIKECDSQILWDKMSPSLIDRMYRAFDDYFPLSTTWHGIPIKLKDMQTLHLSSDTSKNSCDMDPLVNYIDTYEYIKKCHKLDRIPKERIEDEIETCSPASYGKIQFMRSTKTLRVHCMNGFVEFKKIILKGKKGMSTLDFYNGFISKVRVNKRYFY